MQVALFDPRTKHRSSEHLRIYALYEVAYTVVDFSAAILFVVGSILFFWEETTFVATWMFLVGSCCFALKPTVRLLRELAYIRLGDYQEVSSKLTSEP